MPPRIGKNAKRKKGSARSHALRSRGIRKSHVDKTQFKLLLGLFRIKGEIIRTNFSRKDSDSHSDSDEFWDEKEFPPQLDPDTDEDQGGAGDEQGIACN